MGKSGCRSLHDSLAGLRDEALHGLRRTGTDAEPIFGSGQVDFVIITLLLRVVMTDQFYELAVTRAALVGHRNAVEWVVAGAFASESDCYCHGSRFGKFWFGARPRAPPEAERDIWAIIFFIFPVFLASFFI